MASASIQGESDNYSKSGDGENLVLLRHCHKKRSSCADHRDDNGRIVVTGNSAHRAEHKSPSHNRKQRHTCEHCAPSQHCWSSVFVWDIVV